MKPICFYHKADLDGVCSAAIVKHFVPDVELYGIDYGEEFPWDKTLPSMPAIFPFARAPEGNPCVNPECEDATGRVLIIDDKGERIEEPKAVSDRLPRFDPSSIKRRTVYMVDFSLPMEEMKKLAACADLFWIDHYQTAISAYGATGPNPFIPGLRRPDLAACELCWNWFGIIQVPDNMQVPVPEAVRLLGIYDSWRKDDPEWQTALAFQYGMRAVTGIHSPESASFTWRVLVLGSGINSENFIVDRCIVGQAILNYQAEVAQRVCETGAHEIELFASYQKEQPPNCDRFGIRLAAIACNTIVFIAAIACNTIVFNSQFFESVYDPEKHDIMVAYCQMKDGRWKVSIYSTKPEIDCGAIAKAFEGGGHKWAAGFVCDKLPWEA